MVLEVVPRGFRDWIYDVFARHRYRVFGRLDTCRLPTADERARALEYELFVNLRQAVQGESRRLAKVAAALAMLDVLAGLAELARD